MTLHPTCEHGLHPLFCDIDNPEAPGPGYDARTRPHVALRSRTTPGPVPDRPAAPEPDWLDRMVGWVDRHTLTRLCGLGLLLGCLYVGGQVAISLL